MMKMKRSQWIAVLGACLLAACASQTPTASRVEQVTAQDGSQRVTALPARLICEQPRCPALSAQWSSQRAGVVVLTIGLPYQTARVTGADFHFGASQVVRLRVPSDARPPALADNEPRTSFDVPLSLIDALAYKPDGWVRVSTEDGRAVNELVRTGERTSDVVDTMRDFLRLVDAASGKPADARTGGNNGLFDLLK